MLPDMFRSDLIEQIERVRRLHRRDLDRGVDGVYLPYALERKYPEHPSPRPSPLEGEREEAEAFGWQWLFPAERLSKDPRSGAMRRHHVCEDFFSKFFKGALRRAEIDKNAVPHSLRSALA